MKVAPTVDAVLPHPLCGKYFFIWPDNSGQTKIFSLFPSDNSVMFAKSTPAIERQESPCGQLDQPPPGRRCR
jgi:hypothetical protein